MNPADLTFEEEGEQSNNIPCPIMNISETIILIDESEGEEDDSSVEYMGTTTLESPDASIDTANVLSHKAPKPTPTNEHEDDRWREMFDKLKKYKQVNGHCCVPQRESSLGCWVANQRREFKSKKGLRDYRCKSLKEIGFRFKLSYDFEERKEHYETLKKLITKKGRVRLQDVKEKDDFREWVEVQRDIILYDIKLKQDQRLSQENVINLVLKMGLLDDADDDTWNAKLEDLIVFWNENHRNPINNDEEKELFHWVDSQRHRPSLENRAMRKRKLALFGFQPEGPIFKHCKPKMRGGSNENETGMLHHFKESGTKKSTSTKKRASTKKENKRSRKEMEEYQTASDTEIIWMCTSCWNRFEEKQEALNCKCV